MWGKLPEDVEDGIYKKANHLNKLLLMVLHIIEILTYWLLEKYCKQQASDDSLEYMCWEYYDDSEKNILTLEQFGDEEFEASLGVVYSPDAFTNILPTSG